MSTNSHSALSNALDVLVNGQQDSSSNIIPSAPAVAVDNSNNYIPLFNPAALTINVPTAITDTDDDDTDDDTDDDHDDDDTDDDNDHKNDSYTAAGAAPGASIINP